MVPKHPLGETEEWREQAAGSSGPGPSHAVWFLAKSHPCLCLSSSIPHGGREDAWSPEVSDRAHAVQWGREGWRASLHWAQGTLGRPGGWQPGKLRRNPRPTRCGTYLDEKEQQKVWEADPYQAAPGSPAWPPLPHLICATLQTGVNIFNFPIERLKLKERRRNFSKVTPLGSSRTVKKPGRVASEPPRPTPRAVPMTYRQQAGDSRARGPRGRLSGEHLVSRAQGLAVGGGISAGLWSLLSSDALESMVGKGQWCWEWGGVRSGHVSVQVRSRGRHHWDEVEAQSHMMSKGAKFYLECLFFKNLEEDSTCYWWMLF